MLNKNIGAPREGRSLKRTLTVTAIAAAVRCLAVKPIVRAAAISVQTVLSRIICVETAAVIVVATAAIVVAVRAVSCVTAAITAARIVAAAITVAVYTVSCISAAIATAIVAAASIGRTENKV